MFKGRTAAEIRVTPQDDRDANGVPGLTLARLAWCWEQTRGPVAFSEFGAQSSMLWGSVGKHIAAGRRVLGNLDHVQFTGPSEQKVCRPFMAQYPGPWESQDIAVGTSMYKGQILHDKKFVFNAPLYGYQPAVGDFETIEDAFAAGAAISWFGSLNISDSAALQSNTVCIMPGIVVATMFVEDIVLMHDYIIAHQQQYQPFPRAASQSPETAAS